MTHETPFPGIQKDPPPLSIGPQVVTIYPNGSWKAVVECPKNNSDCNTDYQFSTAGGGVNHRRMANLRQRMGV